jgi:osmotically inducible protein OsmC
MDKIIYTATVDSKGGRDGHIHSSDNVLDLELAIVDGLGHTSGKQTGTNPEQLFAGGYAACFESTIAGVADAMKIEMGASAVTGIVNLNKGPQGLYLSVKLEVSLPGLDKDTAGKLILLAHQNCPYSKAIHGNVEIETILTEN